MAVLLLFDIDGTLVRVPAARRACQAAFRQLFGSDEALEGFDFSGQTDQIAFRELALRAGAQESDADKVIKIYLDHLEQEIQNDPGWSLPGVRQLLDACADDPNYRLALGTGNVERGARAKLLIHNLDHYFPTGGFADDAEGRPEILAAGLSKAREYYDRSFDRVIVIGDTPSDIDAARQIGAKVLAVATGRPTEQTLRDAEPDLLLPDLSNLSAGLAGLKQLAQ